MGFERHHSALVIASLITVASFVGATAYTQNRLGRLDTLSSTLETDAVPSIDLLSRAAVRLTRLGQLLDDVAVSGPRRAQASSLAASELEALERDVAAYVRLPPLPGERDFWAALRADVGHAVELIKSALAVELAGEHSAVTVRERTVVDDALHSAMRSVVATIDYDVKQSKGMARDVRNVRAATQRMIIKLDAVATMIALAAVVIAYRASRRHDDLLREHSSLLAARVTELDRFAGRVAHDVLSPLGTIGAALSLLSRSADAQARTYIDRSQRALERVQQLVDGLLTFARSGARPDRTSRCVVALVLANVVTDCSEAAAEKGIDLVLDTDQSLEAPCTVGVITSIAQNLVRNAIKYMGSRPVRRIVVRARAIGSMIRMRGPHETASGTGLGLATVKRLAETHGGAVGVHSTIGKGSLFWVEVPLAAIHKTASTHLSSVTHEERAARPT
jgi:signal transduction histidine kinase